MAAAPWVLGLNFSHNGAACLLHGDQIVAAVQEERLTRVKYDRIYGSKASLAIEYCLSVANIAMSDLDAIAFATQGRFSDAEHQIRENRQFSKLRSDATVFRFGHHYAHAVSAYAWSGFADAAILVADGLGSPFTDLEAWEVRDAPLGNDLWETTSLYSFTNVEEAVAKDGVNNGMWITPCVGDEMQSFGSLGGMYSAVSRYLFGEALDSGKVMGLSSFGHATIATSDFLEHRKSHVVFSDRVPSVFRDAIVWGPDNSRPANLAASVQSALESAILDWCKVLRSKTNSTNFCFAGGVALNGIVNERIVREAGFQRCFFMPAAEDCGVAIGAAFGALKKLQTKRSRSTILNDSFGRSYTKVDVDDAITRFSQLIEVSTESVTDAAVKRITDGDVVALFSSGSEFSARSLGQRSILADARDPGTQERLNSRVKHREPFRPFAPVVLEEHAADWFDLGPDKSSKYMMRVVTVRADRRKDVPAVVHVDGTARIQTVGAERPALRAILERYYAATGVPLLVNTSFNVMGEPIVETPEDAIHCLLETDIDACILENRLIWRHRSISSFLDIPLMRTVNEVVVSFEAPSYLPLAPGKLSFEVSTRYGDVYHEVGAEILDLVRLLDHSKTGRDIVSTLNATRKKHHITENVGASLISMLRRTGLIRYVNQRTGSN